MRSQAEIRLSSATLVGQRDHRPAAPLGVLGLGLMGKSIVACLLASGDRIIALETDQRRARAALAKVRNLLRDMKRRGFMAGEPDELITHLSLARNYGDFRGCALVIESIVEDLPAKRSVIRALERVVSPATLIASNTSAIPVSSLQRGAAHPGRILGLHWAEPAHITRFMEIICGQQTRKQYIRLVVALARRWGKEPSVLRRDLPGFITNRCMYALIREAFYLVESGYATVTDVDRSLRNDLGYWITLAGPFRFMDLTGIPAYAKAMQRILPTLSCQTRVPRLMRRLITAGAEGVGNARGFYRYTPAQARRWQRVFLQFSYDIRDLAQAYPEDIGDHNTRHGPSRRRTRHAKGLSGTQAF